MNFYEISATLENGSVHKTKIYEINQDRALNRASKFALQFDATGCAKKTVQLIQENAGVPKGFWRAWARTAIAQWPLMAVLQMPRRTSTAILQLA